MKILFATSRQYPPDRHGGAQICAHALLMRMMRRGHACEVVAARAPGAGMLLHRVAHVLSGRRWLGRPDHLNGYAARRGAPWHLARLLGERVEQFGPDVLVIDQPETVAMLRRDLPALRLPVVLRIADVSFRRHEFDPAAHPNLRLFAVSRFIADALQDAYDIDVPVLHPIIDFDTFRTPRLDPQAITFINPIAGKGLDVVLRTAALLPHRQFRFVSGWPRPGEEQARLEGRIAALPNVELVPWSRDVRPVYERTRLLLFPAQWEEGFGRVALEAHANGIPVVASAAGGLPEAVGEGGRILPSDAPPDTWADAVEEILRDDVAYRRLSHAALANTQRPEFDAERITDAFETLLRSAAAGERAPRAVTPPAARPAD